MVDFPIIDNDYSIRVKTGYKINPEFSCYQQDKGNWIIIDSSSGLLIIDNIKTGKECFNYIKTMSEEIKQKIIIARSKSKYKEVVKIITEWRKKEYQL